MLFNSTDFWIFFAVVLLAFAASPQRLRNLVLLGASYVFYGFWDWRFLALILFSTIVDFFSALAMVRRPEKRRTWLIVSVCTNLGVLGFFKYFGFFVENFRALAGTLGVDVPEPALEIVLPVGISFYTFQTMSYTIDVYRGVTKPVVQFLDFALYVSYFPQLVAGPIERSSTLLPQLLGRKTVRWEQLRTGTWLILFGLFKKVVLADNMARVSDSIFGSEEPLGAAAATLGIYAFALQIYGDFSGYTDIARGVSKFFGVDLVLNFRRPYFSTGPRDFWRRWHISLSQWLRDYLYVPLGGNRGGKFKTYRNLMLTMLLGGLWHGASWMFVIWGALHGLYLILERGLDGVRARSKGEPKTGRPGGRAREFLAGLAWFHAVCFAWIFFRAESFDSVSRILSAYQESFVGTSADARTLGFMVFCAAPVAILDVWAEIFERRRPSAPEGAFLGVLPLPLRALLYAALIVLLAIAGAPAGVEFIYFQF